MSLIKVLFIVIAGIFVVSYLNDAQFLEDFTLVGEPYAPYDTPADRTAYTRSYDTNNDGSVSASEYKSGELDRINDEVSFLEREVTKALESAHRSPYRGMVELDASGVYAEKRNEEYMTLSATYDNARPIDITGWRLKSLISGRNAKIPEGVRVLSSNRPWFANDDILLAPGDRAYVTTGGAAGISTSFLTNMCTGYFDYTYRFTPSLSTSCPRLEDEDLDRFDLAFDDFDKEKEFDACMDAIESVSSCERGVPDRGLTSECRNFISDYGNYDGCVKLHKDDADFLGTEWRIFLNSSYDDLWRDEREAIALMDQNGLIVDVVRY